VIASALRRTALLGTIALLASTMQTVDPQRASVTLGIPAGPFVAGSRVNLHLTGIRPPYDLHLSGPGTLQGTTYVAPDVATTRTARLIVGNASSLGAATLTIVPPPAPTRALLAVATYDGGVVLHDPETFARIAVVATGGSPGDVAFESDGTIATSDTAGDDATLASRAPWKLTSVGDVPLGNEVIADSDGAVFISNRDVNGAGALTRIARDGSVSRILTGQTAEGLAIDRVRDIIYVGNVNDGTVLAVDARTMKPLQRIAAVPRVFGIALSANGSTLYAVANQSQSSPFAQPGFVAAVALGRKPHVVARSAKLEFPLGVAIDDRDARLFVTDESANVVYVLDAKTLRPLHAPLRTCLTPWKPYFDADAHRLFVPCARADKVDVFDSRTLARVKGAPFLTGGYPLGVASWP
jgi:DNA-binding beta-propeller fold protein YncE